jgi:hypothetical protein
MLMRGPKPSIVQNVGDDDDELTSDRSETDK